MTPKRSFNAEVIMRNNSLNIGDIVYLKPIQHHRINGSLMLCAEINRQTGADTGVYITGNELYNNFKIINKELS